MYYFNIFNRIIPVHEKSLVTFLSNNAFQIVFFNLLSLPNNPCETFFPTHWLTTGCIEYVLYRFVTLEHFLNHFEHFLLSLCRKNRLQPSCLRKCTFISSLYRFLLPIHKPPPRFLPSSITVLSYMFHVCFFSEVLT